MPTHLLLLHEVAPEVFLGSQRVVGTTAQREIGWVVPAASSECLQMV